ncbi:MAG: CDP-alcohol phosphatidyltransferase family protein [Candidatus Omnitrophica bacterium]|nr:CDP-alcohol phosphatidyltransferase family protein [Candidatus Omnitrophota bacterium]
MLTPHKALFRGASETVARIFIRMGLSPNGITLLGLFLGLLTCLFFLWNRNPILFGFLIVLWSLFDAVDGAAARLTHRVTKFGSYLDAVCDRIFEMAVILTVAQVTGHWALSFLLVTGSMMISYAKARAAMEISVSNDEWPDLMERTERGLIFVLGLILWGFFPGSFFGRDLFFWMLVGLNLAVYGTLIQRILRAKRLIESRT